MKTTQSLTVGGTKGIARLLAGVHPPKAAGKKRRTKPPAPQSQQSRPLFTPEYMGLPTTPAVDNTNARSGLTAAVDELNTRNRRVRGLKPKVAASPPPRKHSGPRAALAAAIDEINAANRRASGRAADASGAPGPGSPRAALSAAIDDLNARTRRQATG